MRVRVLDRATGQAHSFFIQGSWDAGITVGSDPACDLVLCDSDVAPRQVATMAAGYQAGLKALAAGVRVRNERAPLAVGATTQSAEVDVSHFALSFVDDDPRAQLAGAPPPPETAAFRLGISASLNPRVAPAALEDTPAQRATDEAYEEVLSGRWLAPDASLAALESEAEQWVRDRIDEHFALLSPFLSTLAAPDAGRVVFLRSFPEACELWRSAWQARDGRVRDGFGHLRAIQAAQRALPASTHEGAAPSRDLDERLELAWWVFRENNPAWRNSVARVLQGSEIQSGEELARKHLMHRRATGGAPSLWSPLHAIWQRGAWPMALPDGAFFVLVPVITPTGEMATDVPSPPNDYTAALAPSAHDGTSGIHALRELSATLALRPFYTWKTPRQ